jgi:hypothetical protein
MFNRIMCLDQIHFVEFDRQMDGASTERIIFTDRGCLDL